MWGLILKPYVLLINTCLTPPESNPEDEMHSAEVYCAYGRDSKAAGLYVRVKQQPLLTL